MGAMVRGPLMPMPTMAMAAMAHTAMARGLLMLMPTTAMAAMAHTAMARGPLMLTTDSATAMAAMAHTTDKLQKKRYIRNQTKICLLFSKVPRTDMIREFCLLLYETKIHFL